MVTPPVDALQHFEAQEAYKMQMKALQVTVARISNLPRRALAKLGTPLTDVIPIAQVKKLSTSKVGTSASIASSQSERSRGSSSTNSRARAQALLAKARSAGAAKGPAPLPRARNK